MIKEYTACFMATKPILEHLQRLEKTSEFKVDLDKNPTEYRGIILGPLKKEDQITPFEELLENLEKRSKQLGIDSPELVLHTATEIQEASIAEEIVYNNPVKIIIPINIIPIKAHINFKIHTKTTQGVINCLDDYARMRISLIANALGMQLCKIS